MLVKTTSRGLYCPRGDFYVDPWRPVDRAVITHAHADHARPGHQHYLTTEAGQYVLQTRMGPQAVIDTVAYGDPVSLNGVRISLHPAGHVLGSAQVRIEYRGEICVVSGDYKTDTDQTSCGFEVVPCNTFITESTFGLPVYRWPSQTTVVTQMNEWWRENAESGRPTVLFAYAFGKAQRVLAGLDPDIGPIFCHGAVERLNADYRRAGIDLPPTAYAGRAGERRDWSRAMIVAPPSAMGTTWLRKFGDFSSGFASGWMLIRGTRRRRSVDRGFVLSDHADWDGLQTTIKATGAERVLVTHGHVATMVRWLSEQGVDAAPLATEFEGEQDDSVEPVEEELKVETP